jgi:indolepyruvate ferredoxin oxidoreductase beta subunit
MADPDELIALANHRAQRLILMDMEAMAGEHESLISAVLLGAICGAGVVPIAREAFEEAILTSGIAVASSLPAFKAACMRAAAPQSLSEDRPALSAPVPLALAPPLQDRIRRLPSAAQPLAEAGVRRVIDYQDPAYGAEYLGRLERVAALEVSGAGTLTQAVARSLALWMSFEDPIRVADLKTRAARFARVRGEARLRDGAVLSITDFMKPGVEEIAGTLPAGLGRWVLGSPLIIRALRRSVFGLRIRTSSVAGFLLLYSLAGLRRFRRQTLRFRQESARIAIWLERIEHLAVCDHALAVELARAQRLIKGYGETCARGLRRFTRVCAELGRLSACPDGAARMARLQEAALADEEGRALARELAAVPGAAWPREAPRRLPPLP